MLAVCLPALCPPSRIRVRVVSICYNTMQALADEIMESSGPEDERLTAINDRLDELDPSTFETNARKVCA